MVLTMNMNQVDLAHLYCKDEDVLQLETNLSLFYVLTNPFKRTQVFKTVLL